MQNHQIGSQEAGQRLDKFLHKYFPEAGTAFLYKMLRKKNIVLNKKKAEGKEILVEGDSLDFFFSEETFAKFRGMEKSGTTSRLLTAVYEKAYESLHGITVLYEDADMLALNKPAGVLTQKAEDTDVSLNEWMIGYLLKKGCMTEEILKTFKPSVLNRLDRNTSGLVLCGISLKGSQILSRMIHDRTVHKYYAAVVKGRLDKAGILGGVLEKDEIANKVTIKDVGEGKEVRTIYEPAAYADGLTLLSIELVTGKTHQIRAHMAGIGHPLLGDAKYGDRSFNEAYRKKGVKSQLLHAQRMVFPTLRELPEEEAKKAKDLAFLGKTIEAPLPEVFHRVGF